MRKIVEKLCIATFLVSVGKIHQMLQIGVWRIGKLVTKCLLLSPEEETTAWAHRIEINLHEANHMSCVRLCSEENTNIYYPNIHYPYPSLLTKYIFSDSDHGKNIFRMLPHFSAQGNTDSSSYFPDIQACMHPISKVGTNGNLIILTIHLFIKFRMDTRDP